jgi:hypothetical protein
LRRAASAPPCQLTAPPRVRGILIGAGMHGSWTSIVERPCGLYAARTATAQPVTTSRADRLGAPGGKSDRQRHVSILRTHEARREALCIDALSQLHDHEKARTSAPVQFRSTVRAQAIEGHRAAIVASARGSGQAPARSIVFHGTEGLLDASVQLVTARRSRAGFTGIHLGHARHARGRRWRFLIGIAVCVRATQQHDKRGCEVHQSNKQSSIDHLSARPGRSAVRSIQLKWSPTR